MTPRRRALAGALLAATTTAGLAGLHVPTAQAATGSAPVTAPDTVTVYVGGGTAAEPLANDSDPDGDELAVCRVPNDAEKRFSVFIDADGPVEIIANPRTKPGTYTLTYYACDLSYLTPGTITVTVEATPRLKAIAVTSKPGLVRFRNPSDNAAIFFWGSFPDEEVPDGSIRVPAGGSKVVRVHHTLVSWAGISPKGNFVKEGRIRVTLPKGDRHPPVTDPEDEDDGTTTTIVATRAWLSRTPAPR
jgi:methionine-rich copper-binding protein CopC